MVILGRISLRKKPYLGILRGAFFYFLGSLDEIRKKIKIYIIIYSYDILIPIKEKHIIILIGGIL